MTYGVIGGGLEENIHEFVPESHYLSKFFFEVPLRGI
jgi:hypothetical protein